MENIILTEAVNNQKASQSGKHVGDLQNCTLPPLHQIQSRNLISSSRAGHLRQAPLPLSSISLGQRMMQLFSYRFPQHLSHCLNHQLPHQFPVNPPSTLTREAMPGMQVSNLQVFAVPPFLQVQLPCLILGSVADYVLLPLLSLSSLIGNQSNPGGKLSFPPSSGNLQVSHF